jgi:hypothetical protein
MRRRHVLHVMVSRYGKEVDKKLHEMGQNVFGK